MKKHQHPKTVSQRDLASTCCAALCFKPCFAFDPMSSWHSVAGYGFVCGRRRGSWVRRSEMRSEEERFFQKRDTGNWWCRTDCSDCASVTNEAAEPPQTLIQEKTNILEEDAGRMGNDSLAEGHWTGSSSGTRRNKKRQSISRHSRMRSTGRSRASRPRSRSWRRRHDHSGVTRTGETADRRANCGCTSISGRGRRDAEVGNTRNSTNYEVIGEGSVDVSRSTS